MCAGVVKLVDAGDSKSPDGNIMPVRFRPPAPAFDNLQLGETPHVNELAVPLLQQALGPDH